MRWTKEGAHRLLQVRVQVLNDELRRTFCRWYPGMGETPRAAKASAKKVIVNTYQAEEALLREKLRTKRIPLRS